MTRRPFTVTLSRSYRGQRGAATLIVVMLLFFIISMVAAYTSRNLIFEQRTSANQYRSTQAFEAAEAGLEWAIAQLNAGRISNACASSTDVPSAANESFAQRYLRVDSATGVITLRPVNAAKATTVQAKCVFDSRWRCACPVADDSASTALGAAGGAGPAPAFTVRFVSDDSDQVGLRTDLIQLESNACTRLADSCVRFSTGTSDDRGSSGDGVASTSVLLALRGAVTRPPSGVLTVAGTLADLPGGATLLLSNQEATASGLTLHTGGSNVPAVGLTLRGMPGTPPASTWQSNDASLAPAAAGGFTTQDRRFAQFFGVRPAAYFGQPGMVTIDGSAGCAAANVNEALRRNPGRAIRIQCTPLLIDADIGTAAAPVLLIVEGDVTFSAGVTAVGLIYGHIEPDWSWTVNGAANIVGAVVAESNLTLAGASGAMVISYDKPTLTALRVSYGTFVRVPGSWKDFQ